MMKQWRNENDFINNFLFTNKLLYIHLSEIFSTIQQIFRQVITKTYLHKLESKNLNDYFLENIAQTLLIHQTFCSNKIIHMHVLDWIYT